MSEDGDQDDGGWFDSLAGPLSKAHGVVEGIEGAKATQEVIEGAKGAAETFEGTGLELTPEIAAAAGGMPSFDQTVAQAQYAAGSEGGLLGTAGKALAPFALEQGVMGGVNSIKDMRKDGVNVKDSVELGKSVFETTSGGIGTLDAAGSLLESAGGTELGGAALEAIGATEAGAGATAAAAAAAPVGAVAGGAALGIAGGNFMAETADSSATKTGVWGKDASGTNKSAMDWGAGWGTWVDSHIGDDNPAHPSLLGGLAAADGAIVGGVAGTAQAGWNGLKSLL